MVTIGAELVEKTFCTPSVSPICTRTMASDHHVCRPKQKVYPNKKNKIKNAGQCMSPPSVRPSFRCLTVRKVGRLLQRPRVPVHLLHHALDTHLLAVELHDLSVLCRGLACVNSARVAGGVYVLNLTVSVLGSVDVRGSSCVVTAMPCWRADGGSCVRNSRAALDRTENGLNRVVTSVMNRVSIVRVGVEGGRRSVVMSSPGVSSSDAQNFT